MTEQEWLEKVRLNASELRSLIANHHPRANVLGELQEFEDLSPENHLPITAPTAERACQVVREQIVQERGAKFNPLIAFDNALADGDCGEVISILSGAWFGVPESTSCWGITGFAEACDLLEDPPEQEFELLQSEVGRLSCKHSNLPPRGKDDD